MRRSLTDTLADFVEFLDDYVDQEIDTHVIVREQEIIAARFREDLSDEQKERFVAGLTELRDELDERGKALATLILAGLDLLDDDEDED